MTPLQVSPSRGSCARGRGGGFTLVELAIALAIAGLLLGMLLPSLGARMAQRQLDETRQVLADAQEALLGFAVAHGRLPRPATSASDGQENPSICVSESACTGFLPWQTLGVRKSDGWQKLIRYSVSPAFARPGMTLGTSGTKIIQSRNEAGDLVYLVGSASGCGSDRPCAAAVIHSAGKRNWGTLENGVAVGDSSSTNADEDTNEAASSRFIARGFGELPGGGEFDDVVTWLPTTILMNRMVAAGRLP